MADDYFKRGNWNKKDEYYTPPILVDAIIPYLKINSNTFDIPPEKLTIWCPFDTENSEFVIRLRQAGFKVIHSHIWTGQDFFHYEPDDEYHYIVSNPPYTKKLQVFERLYNLGKPFAMVMGLPILNYQEVGVFFSEKQKENKNLQLLIVDKKVSFDGNTASFNNSYFCWDFLYQDLIFHHLDHNNSNKHYVGSRMSKDVLKNSSDYQERLNRKPPVGREEMKK